MKPFYQDQSCTIYHGDALMVLPLLETTIDAVITDPPYSSGGQFRGDRNQSVITKYVNSDSVETCRVGFTGDNRDQRGFLAWCSLWMTCCHALCRDGGVLCCFSDWRQIPILTDSLQCGGFVWRGLGTWWKPGIRMQRGRFSASAEYVIYASRGVPSEGEKSPQNVIACQPVDGEDKCHVAEKPVEVLRWVMGLTTAGATVLDPFCGSGSTLRAAKDHGRKAIGIEIEERYCEIAAKRLEQGVFEFTE